MHSIYHVRSAKTNIWLIKYTKASEYQSC